MPSPLHQRLAAALLALLTAPAFLSAQAEDIYTYTNSQGDVVFTDHPTKGAKKITVTPPPPIPLTPINLPPPTPVAPPAVNPAAAGQTPAASPNALVPSVPMTPPPVTPAPMPSAPLATPGSPSLPAGDQLKAAQPTLTAPSAPAAATPPMTQRSNHYQTLQITEPKAGVVNARAGGTIFVQTELSPPLDITAGDRLRILIDGNTRVDDSTGNRFMISDLTPGTHAIIAVVMRQGKNIFQSNPVVIQLQPAAATPETSGGAPN
ncbi:hypothetical protein [Halothiobacillus sp. DCM-1]|uniref:hypothetical protein n=1 Tax=Halothiobacillus sp. DCM-1 TaxID=3112558 RepID=UPI003245F77B